MKETTLVVSGFGCKKGSEKGSRFALLVPLNLHYAKGRIKLEIGLAKGKKQYDKGETEKERDWVREKSRLMQDKRT